MIVGAPLEHRDLGKRRAKQGKYYASGQGRLEARLAVYCGAVSLVNERR